MPWTVFKRKKQESAFGPGLWIVDAKGKSIVDTGLMDTFPLSDENKAKIEALPELLEACKRAVSFMRGDHETNGIVGVDAMLGVLNAAISKAEPERKV